MARVPKSAFSPDACPQGFHLLHLHLRQGAEDHLRDAHARLDEQRFLGCVEEDDLDLPAVIRVNRSGRVQDAQSQIQSQPAAGLI